MKKLILLAVVVLTSLSAWSAEPLKFSYELDYLYTLGLTQRQPGGKLTRSNSDMHGNSFHFTALYNVNEKFSAGLGIGVDCYSPHPTTIPLFASFRYTPFAGAKSSDIFGFANLGYAPFAKYYHNLNPGMVGDIGLGWKKMFSRHFGINFKAGYNVKQFRQLLYTNNPDMSRDESKCNAWRHSLEFGFGLVF